MKRSILYSVSLTLFFSLGYIYLSIAPAYGEPAEDPTKNLKDRTHATARGSTKGKEIYYPDELYNDIYGDGDSDEEDVEECLEDCRTTRNLALIGLLAEVGLTIAACVSCFGGFGPGCLQCIAGLVAGTAGFALINEEFEQCKEDCLPSP